MKEGSKPKRVRESSFGWLVNALARRADARMREELAELGLDLSSFATLMTLFEREGIAQAELSAAVGVQSYATTRTLDKMEQEGLVERRANPKSRRAHQVFLTKKGRACRGSLIAIIARVNEEALQPLSAPSRTQLVKLLQEIELASRDD